MSTYSRNRNIDEDYSEQRRAAKRLQEDAARERIIAGLRLQAGDLVRKGVLPSALPVIHSQLGPADLVSAQDRLNKLTPTDRTATKAAAPTLAQLPEPASTTNESIVASKGTVRLGLGDSPVAVNPIEITPPAANVSPTTPGKRVVIPEQYRRTGAGLVAPAEIPAGPNAIVPREVAVTPNAEQSMSIRTNGAWDNWTPVQRQQYLRSISGKPDSGSYDLDAYAKKSLELKSQAEAQNTAADAARGGPEQPGYYDANGKFLGEARYSGKGHLVDIPREAIRFVGQPASKTSAAASQPVKSDTQLTPDFLTPPSPVTPTKSSSFLDNILPQPEVGPVSSYPRQPPSTGVTAIKESLGTIAGAFGGINYPKAVNASYEQVGDPTSQSRTATFGSLPYSSGQPPAPSLERLPTPTKPAPENQEPKYAAPPPLAPNLLDDEEQRRDLAYF